MKMLKIGTLFFMSMTLTVPTARAEGKLTTVKGYVIDSACAFVKDLKKPISPECALACAKAGSPLVILADDGLIYWPISAEVPATGQNERLMPCAGQRVTVTGMGYQKGGSHAIVINKIERIRERMKTQKL
jgi:hypothetical protein